MNINWTIVARFVRRLIGIVTGVFLIGCATVFASDALPVTNDTISKAISEAFHYTPRSGRDKTTEELSSPSPASETLTLEKFVVTHYNESHKLELLLGDQAKRIREESFSWRDGGVIIKKTVMNVTTELKLKFDQQHQGFDLINFAW